MLAFLRKWYILVAIGWLIVGGAIVWRVPPAADPILSLSLMLLPLIGSAVLLATRGFRKTTVWRVMLYIYLAFLIPTGLFMFADDLSDKLNNPGVKEQWMNTWFWFNVSLEGGFLVSPVVFVFAAVLAYLNNTFLAGLGEYL